MDKFMFFDLVMYFRIQIEKRQFEASSNRYRIQCDKVTGNDYH